jgi:CheY-like chemotaxis protein
MEEEGYQVITAKDGSQCLTEYALWQPDMVLLDAIMPEMDGFTCCRHLRELPGGSHIPILIATVLDDQDSIDQAFAAGATDYITKPIHWAVLSQRVKYLLAASQALMKVDQVKAQLLKQQEWEQLFKTITQQLCQPLPLKQFLNSTMAAIQAVAQVERVILYQRNNQILAEGIAPGYPSLQELSLKSAWETQYWTDYQMGKAIAIDDLSQVALPESAIAQLKESQSTAALIVPIILQEKVWGLLCAHQCQPPRPWESGEIDKFTYLGNLIAIAIYQAQLRKMMNDS